MQLELDVINNAIAVASQQANLPNDAVNNKRKVDEISPAPIEVPIKRPSGPVMSVPPPMAQPLAPAPLLSSSDNNPPEDLPEDQTCVICLTNKRSVLLMPCR